MRLLSILLLGTIMLACNNQQATPWKHGNLQVSDNRATFTPPGEPSPGNDWVLVISSNRDTL